MKLFNVIDIETSSFCNRHCASCLRNSWPNRQDVAYLFKQRFMQLDVFKKILAECRELKFDGRFCLCHWNEPLLDRRLPQLARMAAEGNQVSIATNGDALTADLARQLDGVLTFIDVSLYGDSISKADWVRSLFKKTSVRIKGMHRVAHNNERGIPLIDEPCRQSPRRCIVAHNGQYLYCCEDLVGEFRFGSFPTTSLHDYWFGKRHVEMWTTLYQPGGRRNYEYCSTCPWVFGKAEMGTPAATYTRP